LFFSLSKLLDLLLSPLTWALVLGALAVPWTRRRARRWKRRRGFAIAALALLFVLSLEPVANGILYSMEHDAPSTYQPDVTYDAIILLGGLTDEDVTRENGQPAYNDSVERVVMAHRLVRDGKARFVVPSGGMGEAGLMAAQLRDWGVDEGRIVLEDQARNTHENAVFSAAIAKQRGWQKLLVVTSAFHMKRSAECFHAVGVDFDTYAVDYRATQKPRTWLQPRAHFFSVSSAMIRELFGRFIYRVQGYSQAEGSSKAR
jgi:uncharacterized SAM-binding protein YcdF (DUF218 family)